MGVMPLGPAKLTLAPSLKGISAVFICKDYADEEFDNVLVTTPAGAAQGSDFGIVSDVDVEKLGVFLKE